MNKMSFDQLVSRFENSERQVWQKPEEVIKYIGNLKDKTILDIGCGTGYFAFKMAEHGAKVFCADVDKQFLEYVDNKKAVKGFTDDQLSTKLIPENTPDISNMGVDKVLLVNTYHHIDNRTEYFKEVSSSLNEEGEVIIIDFFKNRETNMGPPKKMRVSYQTVVSELGVAGLNKYTLDTTLLPYQYILRLSIGNN